MISKASRLINMIILSMASKQKILDRLNSNIFSINIYQEYIDNLIDVNLNLIDEPDAKAEYIKKIDEYLKGNIEEPDQVLTSIKEK